ncbi:MAG: Mo-dependent nitrogenase C-terminal domain-containing protein [Pseudanabaena sp. ELA607]
MQTIVYQPSQISAWLRGLMSVALADSDYSEPERHFFDEISHSQGFEVMTNTGTNQKFEPITPEALAQELGNDPKTSQNFLRMAVMMAMADGHYSDTEDTLIHEFATALGQAMPAMQNLRDNLHNLPHHEGHHPDLLNPVREWLDHLDIHDSHLAHFLCKAIPAQCPFERDVVLFGRKILHIPPMCQINPIYDQLVGLRFRSLSYLADRGEDISKYC